MKNVNFALDVVRVMVQEPFPLLFFIGEEISSNVFFPLCSFIPLKYHIIVPFTNTYLI